MPQIPNIFEISKISYLEAVWHFSTGDNYNWKAQI